MEQRRNERAWETGDPRENPLTNGIVRHHSRPGIEPGSPWWEASRLTAQPPQPLRKSDVLCHGGLLTTVFSAHARHGSKNGDFARGRSRRDTTEIRGAVDLPRRGLSYSARRVRGEGLRERSYRMTADVPCLTLLDETMKMSECE
ncbi:hypothetical protein PR048_010458 [Dryococelus australis]|uniref:Uncharacterized protein n=1 Tax=Dryococelus australis TaxID=614101 RepID=A0ABQ9I3W5_9NEOP|nr:hypothetical protein PR048_010458 [Dryococelus australis]